MHGLLVPGKKCMVIKLVSEQTNLKYNINREAPSTSFICKCIYYSLSPLPQDILLRSQTNNRKEGSIISIILKDMASFIH